ncbi:prepilin peptidase [Cryobacterium tagatosivorans]|uniref:Prepilin peptidase n=1 Tax=Cryobacterium tagatosivorans TaxID=1259199 RepID=A0A4R8UC82_9MICO|nr:prepilin peptidase [Cryobacterium tagatosivorans]TFB48964.1 prepilin peptidase [Cryobacterium tagatosivorans]
MNADLWLPTLAGLAGLALGVPLTLLAARMLRAPRALGWRVRLAASLAAGVLFALLALRFGFAPELPAYLLLAAASVTLSIVDVAEKRLPNPLLLATTVIVAAALVIAAAVGADWGAALGALLGGAALFAVYLVLALISPAGVGMGDVKLAAVIGLALGYLGWDTWLIGLVAGFLVGSVVSLVALALSRVSLRGSLPFGPSMLAGAYVAILAAVL